MIPRILHQFWVGPPMPSAYREFAAGWRRLHPAWDYRLWTEDELPPLRNRALYDAASELWPDAVNLQRQFRSDVLRYELLEQFGGVWVDTDFEPRKPLDGLLAGVSCFAAWEIQDSSLCNAIMGAEPGHPFVERLVDGLPASTAAVAAKGPVHASGPRYITAQYRAHPDGVTVFDAPLFYPYGCSREAIRTARRKTFPEAYAIHHWNNRRTAKGWPL